MSPIFKAMPPFLKESGYADITDNTNTLLTKAWNTGNQPILRWLQTQPVFLAHFYKLMEAWRQDQLSWLDVYPLDHASRDRRQDQPLFLDVGGGLGHQAMALRERFPELDGRVVVQDMQENITATMEYEKVEFMQHDFLSKVQPISCKPLSTTAAKRKDPLKAPNSTTCAASCTTGATIYAS